MMARHEGQPGNWLQLVGALLVVGGLCGGSATALANNAEIAQIRGAVQFSLQCNATLGTIEDVDVSSTTPGADGSVTFRGTYKQKLGTISKLGFHGPEASGGVFEGVYLRDRKALKELQFKISLRSGQVPASCLR